MTTLRRRPGLLVAELLLVVVVAAAAVLLAVRPWRSSAPRSTPAARSTTSAPSTPSTQPAPAATRPFAANSVWNQPLPADAPLSAQSSAYVGTLQQQLQAHSAWINTTQYSVPIYRVGPDQPRVRVTLDQNPNTPGSVGELARVFAAGVPIPPGAHAAAGTDQSLVVWQPSRDTLWEFWRAHQVNGVWHAYWGGMIRGVSHSPGYYTNPPDWGGSASSLSILGGVMTIADLRSGHIDHALAMAIPAAAAKRFVYPAQRTDGHDTGSAAIPEGTRFRLDPKLDVNALHLPRVTKMIALAAQRYGIIVRDQAGAVTLYGEDPTSTGGSDPYTGPSGLFDGLAPNDLLRNFPWSHLQVVDPSWNRH